jgi:DoxX-like family
MDARRLVYWTTTTIVALEMLAGGIADLTHGRAMLVAGTPVAVILTQLGYPTYLLTILGICKIPGAIALLVPRVPRLKEWAYAGVVFELTVAAASHVARGNPTGNAITPLVFALLALASWALRPPNRTFGAASQAESPSGGTSPKLDSSASARVGAHRELRSSRR